MGFFDRFKVGIKKSTDNFGAKIKDVFVRNPRLDDEFYEELEEIFIGSDLGFDVTMELIDELKEKVKSERIGEVAGARVVLAESLKAIVRSAPAPDLKNIKGKAILVIGVNGSGKTTSTAKLAHYFMNESKSVLIAAADTFRAAAIEQLAVWAERSGADIVKHERGADAASVVFDAIGAFKKRGKDVLLIDTAGRLHTHSHLLDELKKIKRVADRELGAEKIITLIVLDATNGQNAFQQVKLFGEAVKIDGIILTKLDGTAKGGIVFSIIRNFNIPILFAGLGEGMEDLIEFSGDDFVGAILDQETEEVTGV